MNKLETENLEKIKELEKQRENLRIELSKESENGSKINKLVSELGKHEELCEKITSDKKKILMEILNTKLQLSDINKKLSSDGDYQDSNFGLMNSNDEENNESSRMREKLYETKKSIAQIKKDSKYNINQNIIVQDRLSIKDKEYYSLANRLDQ